MRVTHVQVRNLLVGDVLVDDGAEVTMLGLWCEPGDRFVFARLPDGRSRNTRMPQRALVAVRAA